nr:splicing factor C9orf78 homolog [Pocillopora verrucosa]
MPQRNYRKRREAEESDDDQQETSLTSEALEERKELQRFRKRQAGVSAVALALGKTLAPEEEVESDPFKLKTGGLVQVNDLIQDRNRDREGEDKEKSINLGANFAAETNRRDEDTHMLKYIEEEMAKRKGVALDKTVQNKPKSKEDLLYQVPEHINVRSKIMASEEMLSNQMLSGIPEVDLGIDAKIRNIEATEAAKQAVIEEQRYKKSKEPTEMVPTNMAVNFMLHSRFYDEQKNIDAESKRAASARDKAQEQEKVIRKPTVKADDTSSASSSKAHETDVPVAAASNKKRTGDKVEKATDDFFYEKFKKRARDSWRYQ